MHTMSRVKNESNLNSAMSKASNFVDIFDGQYYNINKRILCYAGLWPYQSVFERGVRNSFILMISISLLAPQVLKLVQSWGMGEVGVFIECFSPTVTNIGCDIKLFNSILHLQEIRRLLDKIRDDWKCTRYVPELKILQEHGQSGRRYTISYLTMVYMAVAAWTAAPLAPIIMDIIAPLNQSRPHVKFFQTDYRVDPDEYFYPIFLHGTAATAVGIGVLVTVDTAFMVFAQHACAMLDIVRYRLENMIQEDNESGIRLNSDIGEHFYYQQVVACMIKHKHSIEYIRLIQFVYEWYLVSIIGLSMLVISCTGSQVVAKGTATEDALRFAFFAGAQIFHLFCNSLPGHWIMDTSSLLPNSAYNCRWYLMSPRSRKLIVLFIRRSLKPCTIVAGKMYVVSLENFRCALQTSLSYLTLLTSMQ